MIKPEDLKKIHGGVFIPKPKKKERGNPNKYVSIPQDGDSTEYDIGEKYCPNCKTEMPCKNMWIADPMQPEDVGAKGEKVEPMWLEVCKKCGYPVEDGLCITNTDDALHKQDTEQNGGVSK